jgi:hypothetical protein
MRLVRPAAPAIAALPNAFSVLRLSTVVSGCLAVGEDLICACVNARPIDAITSAVN